MKNKDTELARRFTAATLQWGGWSTCIGVFVYGATQFDPNHGVFAPQWVSFTFIFSMGVAIAGTLVRSRMRLTQTIIGVFQAGQQSERDRAVREDAEGIPPHGSRTRDRSN